MVLTVPTKAEMPVKVAGEGGVRREPVAAKEACGHTYISSVLCPAISV